MQGNSRTGDGVLNRSLIDKGNLETTFLILITISYHRGIGILAAFNALHKQSSLLITLRPSNLLALIIHPSDTTTHDIIIRTINHRLGVVHQFQFLHTFLLHRTEVLLMGTTQTGKHADGGLDDISQCQHLTRLTDTSLEDTHLRLFIQQPHGERHTNLGVIAARGTHNLL